ALRAAESFFEHCLAPDAFVWVLECRSARAHDIDVSP
ncbi:MAG: hypothetical protein ACI8TX_003942, partial [Hyphomicrobiaceae bacterium]